MGLEFRGVDLADEANWADYADVLAFHRQYPTDELEDFTDPSLFRSLMESEPDVATRLISRLAIHEDPRVRGEAGKLAIDLLPYDERFAVSIILETLGDDHIATKRDVVNYAHDIFEDSGTQVLENISLPSLAKIIRAYKAAQSQLE